MWISYPFTNMERESLIIQSGLTNIKYVEDSSVIFHSQILIKVTLSSPPAILNNIL